MEYLLPQVSELVERVARDTRVLEEMEVLEQTVAVQEEAEQVAAARAKAIKDKVTAIAHKAAHLARLDAADKVCAVPF